MPYDITTRDGITIRNIPDETPADAPELKQRVASIRAQLNPKPTERQELLSSAPMRLAKGGADTITGAAQLLERITPGSDAINRGADAAGQWLNRNVFNRIGLPGDFAGEVLGIRGMTQDQFRKDIQTSEDEYQAARTATAKVNPETGERDPGFDAMRLVGNVASPVSLTVGKFLPGMRAGAPIRQLATRGAVGGAAGAATQPVAGEDFGTEKLRQVAAGAVGGAALGPLVTRAGESLARLVQRWGGQRAPTVTPERIQELVRRQLESDGIDAATLPEQVFSRLSDDVRTAFQQGRQLDPAAALRALDFESLGLPYTRGQVTRNPAQWQREFNLAGVEGVGEPLQQTFQQQMQGVGARFRAGTQGLMEKFDAGDALGNQLRGADRVAQDNVRAAYEAFRQSTGRELEVPLQGLAQDYAQALREFGDVIPAAVRSRFEGLGLMGGTQRTTFSLADAEDLIKTINRHYDPAKRAEATALNDLRRSLQNAVGSAADTAATGDGAMAAQLAQEARATAAARFAQHEATPALRYAASNGAPDDLIDRFVIRGRVSDIENMMGLLPAEGQQQVRAQFMEYLRQKAFGANAAGDGKAAQESFNRELMKIGRPKIVALLGEQGADEMVRIGRVLAYMKQIPEGATPAASGTGQMLTNVLGRARGLRGLPFVNDYLVQPIGRFADRREVASALAGLPSQPAQLDPKTVADLSLLFGAAPVATGIAAGKAIGQPPK